MRALLPLLLLLGCQNRDPRDGTFVGNPGEMDVAVSRVPAGITLTSATFAARSLTLTDCAAGTVEEVALGVVFDALVGRADAVEIPGGEFCEVVLTPEVGGALVLEGQTDGGTSFVMSVDPGELVTVDTFRVDGTPLVWELALGGLDGAALEALGTDVVVTAGEGLALAVGGEAQEGLSIYEDVDGDGQISEGDHLQATAMGLDTGGFALAAGSPQADAGCGCSAAPGHVWWWVWGLPFLALRRRR